MLGEAFNRYENAMQLAVKIQAAFDADTVHRHWQRADAAYKQALAAGINPKLLKASQGEA